MSLKPMYDNIVIKPIKADEKTAGGIYLSAPDNSKSYAEGKVISVGEGYKLQDGNIMPLRVSVGDTVIYRKGVEIDVSDDGQGVYVLSESNIVAIKA